MIQLTQDDVLAVLSVWTGVPADRLRPGAWHVADAERLHAELSAAVVGQPHAIDAATRAVRRRLQLPTRSDERRPMWNALFVGPSGVGKSRLAAALAGSLFGDEKAHLVQIDMSDFRDEHTVARLVGAPPGYVGHGAGGELTNGLRRARSGVVLLDEVEKAHPAVVTQVLIPLLGEGVVHDMNDGHALDATQFVVLMTSNLGTARATSLAGFGADGPDSRGRTIEAVRDFFPREVLGRIDDILVFECLGDDAMHILWDREVALLSCRLREAGTAADVQVASEVSDRILADAHPVVELEGARGLRRRFQRDIEDRVIELVGDGGPVGRIMIDLAPNGGLRFRAG